MTEVDLARERAASQARTEARLLERRARALLEEAGWGTGPEELGAAAEARWPTMEEGRRREIVRRAVEVQEAERAAERRGLAAPERRTKERPRMAKGDRGRRLSQAERETVRQVTREALSAEQAMGPGALLRRLRADHAIELSDTAYRRSYYHPIKRSLARPKPAPRAEAPESAAPAPAAPTMEIEAGRENGRPSVRRARVESPDGTFGAEVLADGRWRLRADIVVPAELGDRVAGAIVEYVMGTEAA